MDIDNELICIYNDLLFFNRKATQEELSQWGLSEIGTVVTVRYRMIEGLDTVFKVSRHNTILLRQQTGGRFIHYRDDFENEQIESRYGLSITSEEELDKMVRQLDSHRQA